MNTPVGFQSELVHPSAFLAAGAILVGQVKIGQSASIWFNAVLRGDCELIQIGARTNVQDGCILHADFGFPCILGDNVTVGHGAVVHGARIANNVLIGMKSVIMNGVHIGENCLIGAGAIVTEGTQVPAGSLVMGLPGKVKRAVSPAEIAHIQYAADHYVQNASRYIAAATSTKP